MSVLDSIDSGELARCLFDEAIDALFVFDTDDLQLVDVNPRAEQLANLPRRELLRQRLTDLFAANDDQFLQEFWSACQATQSSTWRQMFQLLRSGAEPLPVNLTLRHLRATPGGLGIVILQDAADGPVQDELPATHLAGLLDDVDAIFWECELPSGRFTYVSKQAESVLGYPVQAWLSEPDFWINHVHQDDRDRVWELVQSHGELPVKFDYRAISFDGQIVWLHCSSHGVSVVDGSPRRLRGVMLDITKRKNAEETLRESETRHRELVECAPVCIHEIGLDKRLASINPTGMRMIGCSDVDEAVGRRYLDFVADADRPRIERLLSEALEGKAALFEFVCPIQGEAKVFSSGFMPILDETGAVKAVMGTTVDLTESRRAEEKLLFQSKLLDSVPESVAATDLNGNVIHWSRGAEQMYGYAFEEVKGKPITFIVEPEEEQVEKQRMQQVLEHGSWSGQYQQRRKDGTAFWSDTSISLVQDEDGKPVGFIGIDRDITAQKNAEAELAKSEARFRALVENSCDVIVMFSVEGECLYVSPSVSRVLGYQPEELVGQIGAVLAHPDDVERAEKLFAECIQNPSCPVQFQQRIRHQNGEYRTIEITGMNLLHEPGVHAVVSIYRDITERSRAEADLRNSERSLAKSQEIAKLGSWQLQLETRQLSGSAQVFRILGLAEGVEPPSLDQVFREFLHPDDVEALEAALQAALLTGQTRPLEFRLLQADTKAIRYVRAEAELCRDQSSGLPAIIGTLQDITRQKNAELALRESEAQFRALSEASPAIVFIAQDLRVVYSNPAGPAITGYAMEELLGKSIMEIVHPEYRKVVAARHHKRLRGESVPSHYEVKIVTKGGEERWIDLSANLIDYGGAPAALVIGVDFTERKVAEQLLREREMQLAHVARLSTMGEMVAGIAHEINQPLAAIANFADACQAKLEAQGGDLDPDILSWLQHLSQQAVRCGDIIRRLRSFVTQTDDDRCSVDLTQLIQETLLLIRNDIPQAVHIESRIPEPGPLVYASEVQLQQVLVNLLRNACDAIRDSTSPEICLHLEERDGYVRLSVQDNGPGVELQHREQLFDAFFTTKSSGMGMGLAISRSIIESHNGRLRLDPAAPGATFHIDLPLPKSSETGMSDL